VPAVEGTPTPTTPTSSKPKRAPKRYDPYGDPLPKPRRKGQSRAQAAGEDPGMDQTHAGSPLSSPTSPTSPTQPYDAAAYFQAYGGMPGPGPGPGGNYYPVPVPTGSYPPPTGHPMPYTSYPPTGADPHPAYPPPPSFYPQHVAQHAYGQAGPPPGPGAPAGMMHYYPPFPGGWRPAVGDKVAEEENQKPAGDDEEREAAGVAALT
jgi:hypothetical protein